MTLFTKDLLLDVPLVVEKDMLRQIIDLDPRCRGLAVEVAVLFLDLRVISNNVLVTVQALLHGRDPREGGAVHIGVAELALDLLHSRVNPVAERDRLFRAEAFDGHDIKKVKTQGDDPHATHDQQEGQLISEQGIQRSPYFTSCR
jgi:hypothetical protein